MQSSATPLTTISAALAEQTIRSQQAIEAIEAYLRREPSGLASPGQSRLVAPSFWHKLLALLG